MRLIKIGWFVVLAFLLLGLPVTAQETAPETSSSVPTTWVPIGGFYGDTFPGYLDAVLEYVPTLGTDRVYILMMPMSFSYDAEVLTTADLLINTSDSERRRRQLEDACRDIAPPELYCQVIVPPIYTREAAETPEALDYFADDLAGVYFLGGDQTLAMNITANTPLETALADAFARGVVMGGNSAGLAIESRTMIGGYGGDNFGPENGFHDGAVDIWNNDPDGHRGLDFGVTDAVLEQHFFERARISRLLNAIVQDGVPGIGVGVDSYTGALIRNNTILENPFGLYTGAILDVETLGGRDTASLDSGILSVRNVLFHTFAPGEFSYDFSTRTNSVAEAPTSLSRDFDGLAVPEGAGRLILVGGVAGLDDLDVGTAVVFTAVIHEDTQTALLELADTSGIDVIDANDGEIVLPDLTTYDTLVIVAEDASQIDLEAFRAPLQDAWLAGKTLILVDAAAAMVGQQYTAMPPTPYESEDALLIEAATQGVMLQGGATLTDGLGFLPINVEPRLMADNRWGRLIALAYANPQSLALGLPDETTITIDSNGAAVSGDNAAVVLDLRGATLTLGTNDGYVIANGILDVFAPGDALEPTNN